jgi:hypothetical protein
MTLLIVAGVIVGMGLILTGVLAWAGVPTVTAVLAPLALDTSLSLSTLSLHITAVGFLSYVVSSIAAIVYNSERRSDHLKEEEALKSSKPLSIIQQANLNFNNEHYSDNTHSYSFRPGYPRMSEEFMTEDNNSANFRS